MFNRRQFSICVAGATTGNWWGCRHHRKKAFDGIYVSPIFSHNLIKGYAVGLRPYRKSGIRIERVSMNGKTVVYNYGHGGAGMTLSWGSATVAVEHVSDVPRSKSVAVIGGGVIGLSSAILLRKAGFSVRLYAHEFSPNTTSDVAGAEWSPDGVESGPDQVFFTKIVQSSWDKFQKYIGTEFGISRREALSTPNTSALERFPKSLGPAFSSSKYWSRLPIKSAIPRDGYSHQTLLIEPKIYMPALWRLASNMGIQREKRYFESIHEVMSLSDSVTFICAGVGSQKICADTDLLPIRGQLVHLQPQAIDYLLVHDDGYIFPRQDAVVLGGTFERGFSELKIEPAACESIFRRNQAFFTIANGS